MASPVVAPTAAGPRGLAWLALLFLLTAGVVGMHALGTHGTARHGTVAHSAAQVAELAPDAPVGKAADAHRDAAPAGHPAGQPVAHDSAGHGAATGAMAAAPDVLAALSWSVKVLPDDDPGGQLGGMASMCLAVLLATALGLALLLARRQPRAGMLLPRLTPPALLVATARDPDPPPLSMLCIWRC